MKLVQNHEAQKWLAQPSEIKLPNVPPGIHGALDYEELRRLGLNPDDVLDFSANVSPYGPSEAVRAALVAVAINRYPDRECLALRLSLAESHGVSPGHILPGNGASELIGLTARAFAKPGERVLIAGPTYCEYARAALLQGTRVTMCQAREETDFAFDAQLINEQLATLRPRLVYICNPNNPTGAVIAPATINDWVEEFPRTMFIVDEAYLPFTAGLPSVSDVCKTNLLVLRSMTKDHGLAGLRLGYGIGHLEVIVALRQMQPPWSVNAMAQAAGVAALGDRIHLQQSLHLVLAAKQDLVGKLTQLGLFCEPSTTHFFLVRAPEKDGRAFRQALLERGAVIRDCASFGLPSFVRIATRRPEENERLLAAIAEVL